MIIFLMKVDQTNMNFQLILSTNAVQTISAVTYIQLRTYEIESSPGYYNYNTSSIITDLKTKWNISSGWKIVRSQRAIVLKLRSFMVES